MVRLLVMFVVIIVIIGLLVWLLLDRLAKRPPRPRSVAPDDDPDFLRSLIVPDPSKPATKPATDPANKPDDGEQGGAPGA